MAFIHHSDIWLLLVDKLPLRSRVSCSRVCKAWRSNAEGKDKWEEQRGAKVIDYRVSSLACILASDGGTRPLLLRLFGGDYEPYAEGTRGGMRELYGFLQRWRVETVSVCEPESWVKLALLEKQGTFLHEGAKKTIMGRTPAETCTGCELGWTPLHLAIALRDLEGAQGILHGEMEMERQREERWESMPPWRAREDKKAARRWVVRDAACGMGMKPLGLAAMVGFTPCVKMLCEDYGARAQPSTWRPLREMHPTRLPDGALSPLQLAIKYGFHESVRDLLGGEEGHGDVPQAALRFAVQFGHGPCIRVLVESGADVRREDEWGVTPLHLAIQLDWNQVIPMLLKLGAIVEAPAHLNVGPHLNAGPADARFWADGGRGSPLLLAVALGRVVCVRLLLAGGARRGVRDSRGNTVMHVAVRARSIECLRTLMGAGGECGLNATNSKEGYTPLHLAITVDWQEGVVLLIEMGADLEATVGPGRPSRESSDTPLLLAVRHGRTECVRMLLAAGADWGALDSGGNTALHVAVCMQSTECVRLLLGAGGARRKDAVNDDGCTPLHYAAKLHPECLWELKVSGFDIEAPDFGGNTPLHLAAQAGNVRSIEWLRTWGADNHAKTFEGLTPRDLAANRDIEGLLG